MTRRYNPLGDLANLMLANCNGKINRRHNRYVFSDAIPKRAQVIPTRRKTPFQDESGRDLTLIKGIMIFCSNPDVGKPYPKLSHYDVPESICRVCEHRRPARPGIPYPHCQWVKDQRGGALGALKEVSGIMQNVNAQVNEILR